MEPDGRGQHAGASGHGHQTWPSWLKSQGHGGLHAQLYCSGAMEQACAVGADAVEPGLCHWYAGPPWRPVTASEISRNESVWPVNAARFGRDAWGPVRGKDALGFRMLSHQDAMRCVQRKRILVAGDSTTRDTFYELMAVVGKPMLAGMGVPGRYWPRGAHEPRMPHSSLGRDLRGGCMGNAKKNHTCMRDENLGKENHSSIAFQFLTHSNSSYEYHAFSEMLQRDGRRVDAAFVQCPFYEWMKPDVYNYSLTDKQRHREIERVGPRHFAGIGESCRQYIHDVIWRLNPDAKARALLWRRCRRGATCCCGGRSSSSAPPRSPNGLAASVARTSSGPSSTLSTTRSG